MHRTPLKKRTSLLLAAQDRVLLKRREAKSDVGRPDNAGESVRPALLSGHPSAVRGAVLSPRTSSRGDVPAAVPSAVAGTNPERACTRCGHAVNRYQPGLVCCRCEDKLIKERVDGEIALSEALSQLTPHVIADRLRIDVVRASDIKDHKLKPTRGQRQKLIAAASSS
jgi:hypothetical protein